MRRLVDRYFMERRISYDTLKKSNYAHIQFSIISIINVSTRC
jgi:hypothetical protein